MDPALLQEVVRRVVEVAQPDRIILFGSAARGDFNSDSDLDLLVVKSGVQHRTQLEDRINRNFFGLPFPVDIIVVTPEEIERFGHRVGTIIRPALREGTEIYRSGRTAQEAARPEQDGNVPLSDDFTDPQEWLRRAKSNLAKAQLGREHREILFEDFCFDAQQSAEKAIKAVFVARQLDFPKTHDLRKLLELLGRAGVKVPAAVECAAGLTRYAVLTRYPRIVERVDEAMYNAALETAQCVLGWAELEVSNAS